MTVVAKLNRYSKGARSERELLHLLYDNGYSVIRSAGSGVNSISPDLLGIKAGKGIALECKAWDRGSISIEKEKFVSLVKWRDNTGMDTYIAWRMSGSGWFFITLDEMSENGKSYTVTKSKAISISRTTTSIIK